MSENLKMLFLNLIGLVVCVIGLSILVFLRGFLPNWALILGSPLFTILALIFTYSTVKHAALVVNENNQEV